MFLQALDYTFTTNSKTFNSRFVLRYLPQGDLSTLTPILDSDKVMIIKTNNQIKVNSSDKVMHEVSIYDLQVRLLPYLNKVKAQTFTIQNLNKNNQVVFGRLF